MAVTKRLPKQAEFLHGPNLGPMRTPQTGPNALDKFEGEGGQLVGRASSVFPFAPSIVPNDGSVVVQHGGVPSWGSAIGQW